MSSRKAASGCRTDPVQPLFCGGLPQILTNDKYIIVPASKADFYHSKKKTICVDFEHRDSAVPCGKINDFTSSCIFEDTGTYGFMLTIDALVVATERFAWNLSVKRTKNTVPYCENEHISSQRIDTGHEHRPNQDMTTAHDPGNYHRPRR